MYSQAARLPVDTLLETPVEDANCTTGHCDEIKNKLTVLQEITETKIIEAQWRQRKTYDKDVRKVPEYAKGDLVWLYSPQVKKGQSSKFCRPYRGPYEILKSE